MWFILNIHLGFCYLSYPVQLYPSAKIEAFFLILGMAWWSHFSVHNIESLNLLNSNLDPFFDHCNRPHNNSFCFLHQSSGWSVCAPFSAVRVSPVPALCLLPFLTSTATLPPLSCQLLLQCVLLFCDWTLEGETTKENLLSGWKQESPFSASVLSGAFCSFSSFVVMISV